MGQFLLVILLIFGLIAWGLYTFLSPVFRVFRQAFNPGGSASERQRQFGERPNERPRKTGTPQEEQSSVDLIHETNMDLEGGEYVDYEDVK